MVVGHIPRRLHADIAEVPGLAHHMGDVPLVLREAQDEAVVRAVLAKPQDRGDLGDGIVLDLVVNFVVVCELLIAAASPVMEREF